MITPDNKVQDTYNIMNAEDQKVKARQAKTKAAKMPVFKPSILPKTHDNKVVKEAPQAAIQAKALPKTQANETLKEALQSFAGNYLAPVSTQSLRNIAIGPVSQDEVKKFLKDLPPGSFVFKESSREEGVIVAGIVGHGSNISFVSSESKQEIMEVIKNVGLEPKFIDPVQFYLKDIEKNPLIQDLELTPKEVKRLVKEARHAKMEGKTLELILDQPSIFMEAKFEKGHLLVKEMESLKIVGSPNKFYLNRIHHGESSREASLKILEGKAPGNYIFRTRSNGSPVVDLLTDQGGVYSIFNEDDSLVEIFTAVSNKCSSMDQTPRAVLPENKNARQIRNLLSEKELRRKYFLLPTLVNYKKNDLKAVKDTPARLKTEKEVRKVKKKGEKEVRKVKKKSEKQVAGTPLPGNKLIEQLIQEKKALKDIPLPYCHLVNTYRALRSANKLDLLQHIDLSRIDTSAKPLNWTTTEFSAQGPRASMEDAHLHLKLPGVGELYCVFDGHGGMDLHRSHPVADLAKEVFEKEFENELKKNPNDVGAVFNKLFAEIHKIALEKEFPGGSTAVVTFIDKNNIATIGTIADSEARVARKIDGKWHLIPLSLVMDFCKKKEAKRAPKATQKAWAEDPEYYGNAKNRRVAWQNVSRALGDDYEGIGHKAKTSQFQLEKDDLLIVGCDGIWDFVGDKEILRLIDSQGNLDANTLGRFALFNKYARDNVTVMVSKAN